MEQERKRSKLRLQRSSFDEPWKCSLVSSSFFFKTKEKEKKKEKETENWINHAMNPTNAYLGIACLLVGLA